MNDIHRDNYDFKNLKTLLIF